MIESKSRLLAAILLGVLALLDTYHTTTKVKAVYLFVPSAVRLYWNDIIKSTIIPSDANQLRSPWKGASAVPATFRAYSK